MNKIKLLFPLGIMIGTGAFLPGCHTGYMMYDEPTDRIYFTRENNLEKNTYDYSFPYWEQGDQLVVSRRLEVMGFPVDKDREVRIEIVDSLTTAIEGEDFVLAEKIVVPAKEVYAYLPLITWNRRKEGDTRPETLTVGLTIAENENFLPVMGYTLKLCYTHGQMEKPSFWNDEYFGPFSPGLLYKFLDQYHSLKETYPEAYEMLYANVGEYWDINLYPASLDYLVAKYIMTPLYYYYQDNPEPGVVIPPKYQ